MSNPITLTAIAGDKEFSLNWNHVALGVGERTKFTTIFWTNTILGDNTIYSKTLNYYETNPSAGTYVLDKNIVVGITYVVTVIQYSYMGADSAGEYTSNTLTLTVSSAPDALTLKQNDIGTINDLRFITLKAYREAVAPATYSDGYSPLTQIKFIVAYNSIIIPYSFGPALNDVYTLTDLPPDQIYEITARAVNAVGFSQMSSTIIERTSGYPAKPREFKIVTEYVPATDTTTEKTIATLTWAPPTNAEVTDLTGYIIRYREDGHDLDTTLPIEFPALDTDVNMSYPFVFNEPGMLPGKTYKFKIISRNELPLDSLKNESTVELPARIFKPSSPVQSLTVDPRDGSLYLSWDTPSEFGGYLFKDYVVNVDTMVNSIWTPFELPIVTYGNTLTISGLTNNVKTRVKIFPQTTNTASSILLNPDGTTTIGDDYDINGTSTTSLDYYPYKLANKVTSLEGIPSDQSVSLSWDEPEGTGGFLIDHYKVSYSGTIINVLYAELPKDLDAINGTDVDYTVQPVTININPGANPIELLGAPETISRRAFTKPDPISNLQVILSDSRIKLSFSPSSEGGGYPILKYKISYKKHTDIEYTNDSVLLLVTDIEFVGGLIEREFDNLTNGVGYDFKIEVISGLPGENKSISDAVTASNQIPYTTPSGVRNLSVTAADKQLIANWDEPEFPGGFQIDHYDIYLDDSTVRHGTTGNNKTDYTIGGLINGTDYTISIVPVINQVQNSASTPRNGAIVVGAATKPFTTPDPVINLAVVEKDKELVLSWTPPENRGAVRGDGGNDIVEYSVKIFDNLTGTELHEDIVGANVLTYTFNTANVPTITNGSTYTLKCIVHTKTVDNLLNESVPAVIPAAKPYGKPLSINYIIVGNTITVTMGNNGSPITDVLICAPLAANASVSRLANIVVSSSELNLINPTENPLLNTFTTTMTYALNPHESQPMLIVATNPAGTFYVENFDAITSSGN
jgi:hypothetical protein